MYTALVRLKRHPILGSKGSYFHIDSSVPPSGLHLTDPSLVYHIHYFDGDKTSTLVQGALLAFVLDFLLIMRNVVQREES